MTILRFLLHEPLRRRIRLLQAELELLASRVEHLEQALEAAAFPDSETRQRIKASIGLSIRIETTGSVLYGTLVAVHTDALELIDESGRPVIVPAAKITAMKA
ncbi:hypothetical protein MJ257_12930 [Paenibacillus timonensis]|uniref:DUF2642 domain-containing protein n=1 Tax=Paenibacillus timonensis TaxID=225915 RepID=A0ABW3SCH2_9BACL|nr:MULTISPECIES: hypothetical protein [Paenibacillus]MCH1641012.1 hypothetical protein [Paenibacillus timonensis]MDU2242738.1 hypothetical protein [Paenibacillus sp.]